MRRYFTPRCIGMHLTLVVLLPTFAALTIWQYDRATSGNTLSWAYTFEWPLFGGYAIYVWWQLIHDDPGERQAVAAPEGAAEVGAPVGGSGAVTTAQPRPEEIPGWALGEGRRRGPRRPAGAGEAAAAAGAGEAVAGVAAVEAAPGAGRHLPTDEDPELAAYNRYLAELRAADDADARSGRPHRVAH
ncbi:MAG: hypothetical protein M0007_08825 [Actinomycetota bacterium]|nr:hypothetical protein [Actinomycetota bacterium]